MEQQRTPDALSACMERFGNELGTKKAASNVSNHHLAMKAARDVATASPLWSSLDAQMQASVIDLMRKAVVRGLEMREERGEAELAADGS